MKPVELKTEVAAVQKLLDDSKDVPGAIREVLFAVYIKGVRAGAIAGYDVGYKHGRSGCDVVGRTSVADGVVDGLSRRAAGADGAGKSRSG